MSQIFSRLVNFYEKFIKRFCKWKSPSQTSSRRNCPSSGMTNNKRHLWTHHHFLKFLVFTKSFKVHTNVNNFTIDSVFMQDGHSITFGNKKLLRAQLRWPIHEKELYAMVNCLKTWHHYFKTHKTKVFMGIVSLKYFKMQPKAMSNNCVKIIL